MSSRRYLLAAAVSLIPFALHAEEGVTPYIPGATTGAPVGALPPPGFYGTEDSYVVFGSVKGNNGQAIPVNFSNPSESLALLWSSPYHLLGAQYGAGLVQIGSYHQVDASGVGGPKTGEFGLFNTIFEPLLLSWNVGHGVSVALGQAVYFPNGEFHHAGPNRLQTSYANAFYTYEPSLAVTYLKNGWDLTANNVIDVNTKDTQTNYKSGSVYYLDLTAARTFGKFTVGAIGNYTQQFTNDYHAGVKVNDGNRAEHVMLGPMLAYNFGPVTVMARYLNDVSTRNDIAIHEFHLSLSTAF